MSRLEKLLNIGPVLFFKNVSTPESSKVKELIGWSKNSLGNKDHAKD